MSKLLLDINVVLDVGVEREPHRTSSQKVLSAIEKKEVRGFVAAASYPTLYYLLKRELGPHDAREFLAVMSDLLTVVAVDQAVLRRAFAIPVDYEDAIQIACAESCKADLILTRDKSDFKKSPIKALTPSEYLATFTQ